MLTGNDAPDHAIRLLTELIKSGRYQDSNKAAINHLAEEAAQLLALVHQPYSNS
jgi:hypothetical protein